MSADPASSDASHPSWMRHPLVWVFLAALALRVGLMRIRADAVGYEEGYALLLGRSLWSGEGYLLDGAAHTVLHPLSSLLSGGLGWLLGDEVAASHLLVVLAGSALVFPAYALFRRLGGRTVALLGALLLSTFPALMDFVPGEPGETLFHGASDPLFLLAVLSAMALWRPSWRRAPASGALFGLAILARPEGWIVLALFVLANLILLVADRERGRRALPSAFAGLSAALLVASPWLYHLHVEDGRWSMAGGQVPALSDWVCPGSCDTSWRLHGERMQLDGAFTDGLIRQYRLREDMSGLVGPLFGGDRGVGDVTQEVGPRPDPSPEMLRDDVMAEVREPPGRDRAYVEVLTRILPYGVLPVVLLGLMGGIRRRSPREELLFALPTVGVSLVSAWLLPPDPRHHLLLLVPAAYYGARGVLALSMILRRIVSGMSGRWMVGGILCAVLLTSAWEIGRAGYLGFQSPGREQDRATVVRYVADEHLVSHVESGEAVMSVHPALALHSGRPWRALPYEEPARIFEYAYRQDVSHVVMSAYHLPPGDLRGISHLVLFDVSEPLENWEAHYFEWVKEGDIFSVARVVGSEDEADPSASGHDSGDEEGER